MLVYEPRIVQFMFKLTKCENLPAEFESLTIEDIEQGVLRDKFEVLNAEGEYDPEQSTHVIHKESGVTVATINEGYVLDGEGCKWSSVSPFSV